MDFQEMRAILVSNHLQEKAAAKERRVLSFWAALVLAVTVALAIYYL